MTNDYIVEMTKRMEGALSSLKHSLNGLRTGRASASLLDPIKVEAYGSPMPISQVGSVNVPEPRMITLQVWDASLVNATVKAIMESGLGLTQFLKGNPFPFQYQIYQKSAARILLKKLMNMQKMEKFPFVTFVEMAMTILRRWKKIKRSLKMSISVLLMKCKKSPMTS